jgi:hypothetical protein
VDNGDADGDAMAVSPQRGFAADQRRALRLLAAVPNGATEAINQFVSDRRSDWPSKRGIPSRQK